jgi:toxin CcdB
MPQFAVYRNKNAATRDRFPLLPDIQSDLLEPLATRVIVPLTPVGTARSRSLQTLTPILAFEGKDYLMMTPQVAGIAIRELGPVAGDLTAQRAVITAAVDFLIGGI